VFFLGYMPASCVFGVTLRIQARPPGTIHFQFPIATAFLLDKGRGAAALRPCFVHYGLALLVALIRSYRYARKAVNVHSVILVAHYRLDRRTDQSELWFFIAH
jgi:hypothetical protein